MHFKKVFFIIICLLSMSATCFAMTFQQPVKIGMLNVMQAGVGAGGILIEGASHNTGDYFVQNKYNHGNRKTYGKGVARYGDGADALYVHYNMYEDSFADTHLGGSDIKNTVHVPIFCDVIYKITSNEGITLYPIQYIYGPASMFTIVGRQKDGTFVKYIDLVQVSQKYFGLKRDELDTRISYEVPTCHGDTISISYQRKTQRGYEKGEFRFKWDDKAQWFGIEQVRH